MSQIKRTILSQETWNKFTKEEKTAFRKLYHEKLSNAKYAESMGYYSSAQDTKDEAKEMEYFFGKENLQSDEDDSEPTKPKIKVWADVEKEHFEYKKDVDFMGETIGFAGPKVFPKLVATYQISKIIELGYGGVVSEEEWQNDTLMKYTLKNVGGTIAYNDTTDDYGFVAFHTEQQREEFMSYPDNVKLVKQYFEIKFF